MAANHYKKPQHVLYPEKKKLGDGTVGVICVDSKNQLADIFAKPFGNRSLSKSQFEGLQSLLCTAKSANTC